MALLRNREVTIVGPASGATPSPLYTVQYPDGNREDVQLKFIQMSESEHKEWAKDNPTLADHVRTIPDKDVQELKDGQDKKKIEDKRKKQPDPTQPVQVPTFVNPVDVQNAQSTKPTFSQPSNQQASK